MKTIKTHTQKQFFLSVLMAGLGLVVTGPMSAQTLQTIYNFKDGSDGSGPECVLILSGNNLYGTAEDGGVYKEGTLFTVNTNGTGFITLHGFTNGIDGADPRSGLILSGNTLFGTAGEGGGSGNGTVFAVNTNGSGFTTLHSFSAFNVTGTKNANTDGAYPGSELTLSGNTLFGTALAGGSNGHGTIYKVNIDGTGFTTLISFTNLTDGGSPLEGLILSGGVLYGTTGTGGLYGNGTVFAVNTNGSGFATLHSFTAAYPSAVTESYTNSDGYEPTGPLVLFGDTLYGTAGNGGVGGNGTIFAINTNGNKFTVLYAFTAGVDDDGSRVNSDGSGPQGPLVVVGNTIYGATASGGIYSYGTVFSVNTNGLGFVTLHNFNGGDGCLASAGLMMSDDTLFGTTSFLGSSGNGTIFRLSFPLLPIVATTSLPQGTNGAFYLQQFSAVGGQMPYSWSLVSNSLAPGLALAANGTISGTPTTNGIFDFTVGVTDANHNTATQAVSLAISVSPLQILTDSLPNGTNGIPYGETFIAAGGKPPYVWSLVSGVPLAGLLLSSNGVLSGIPTAAGMTNFVVSVVDALSDVSTVALTQAVFFATNGFTTRHFFDNLDGASPFASLILSGNTLYGTTMGGYGGIQSVDGVVNGTVFSVNIDGSGFTNLHNFATANDNSAAEPHGGLILNGSMLYGTAQIGGCDGFGTVFALSTNGSSFTNLYCFTGGNNGAGPMSGLIVSGNMLFGTDSDIGYENYADVSGQVFSIETNGMNCSNLLSYSIGVPDGLTGFYTNGYGSLPNGPLLLFGNSLYGTTEWGGIFGLSEHSSDVGNGTIFKVNTDGSGFIRLYIFSATDTNGFNKDGVQPMAGLVMSGDTLYGTTMYGGSGGAGTVFSVNINGANFTNLHSFSIPIYDGTTGNIFTNSDGFNPDCTLTLAGNTLYGTTSAGGHFGGGTVFEINTSGAGFQTLYNFTGGIDGSDPGAGLVLLGNTLYGTTVAGGVSSYGTVFSLSLPTLQIATQNLPNGTNEFYYNQPLTAIGGQMPYSWSLVSNSLATGLTLATNGIISGTPTTNGAFGFTVKVTDALANSATQFLNLTLLKPFILSLPIISSGKTNFIFQLSGPAGTNYVLQVSTNLVNWTSISTSSMPTGGLMNFTNAINRFSRGFYRVIP